MKKAICVFMIVLCLCSCSKGETEPELLGITFTAQLQFYNEAYVFEGKLLEDATLEMLLKEPEELKDLKLTVNDNGIKAEYKGLIYEANEATMPFSRVVQNFYSPLIAIANDKTLKADQNGEINGEFGGEKCSLLVSPTGLPQKFKLKSKQLELNFYSISVKED